jgi:signal transduction histidine kinase
MGVCAVRPGLKFHVTATLCVLLALATVLTFFVVVSFWLRESALSLAREKELELMLLAEQQEALHPWGGMAAPAFLAALVAEGVKISGAAEGCFQVEGGTVACSRDNDASLDSLKQTLAASFQAGKSVRSLGGLAWVACVPGKQHLDVALRLTAPEQSVGAIALRYALEPHYAKIRSLLRYIAGYLGVNLIILLVVGFYRFRAGIFQPVEHLIRLTDSYIDERGVPFLALQGGDELAQLAGSMQQMLGRIQADREKLQQHVDSLQAANQQLIARREEMVRTEKLSSVGRLAAGLAHEIGNPIGIVQGYLGLIQQHDLGEEEKREFCERADQELQRISRLVRQLLDYSRPASGIEEDVDVHWVLNEAVTLLQPQPLLDGIDLTTRLDADNAAVHGNSGQLLQVFLNCLINAADAIHAASNGSGAIEVATESFVAEAGPMLRVTIADTGVGLAEEELANVFDPFFTTKEPGKGTGLGLSVSYALLQAMGGDITLANRSGGGAVVVVTLPARARREDC